MIQPKFGNGFHDILQYHMFCGDKYFAARVFWTETLWHHSAWIYDGESQEIWNSSEALEQSDQDYMDLHGDGFSMSIPDTSGVVVVSPNDDKDGMELHIHARNTFKWTFPHGGPPTIHQPNLECEVYYRGKTYRGIGYSKRYHFEDRVTHWGYRFIHATTDNHSSVLWSADATFGHKKYAYFKVVGDNGDLHESDLKDSAHRDDVIFGVVDGTQYRVELEELGSWDTCLRSSAMDSQMRQRFCRTKIYRGDHYETGYGVNELCFGTLG